MGTSSAAKTISNIVYALGTVITLVLIGMFFIASPEPISPDAMLPLSWRKRSFVWLAFGSVPMILACMAVYKFNRVKDSVHKKRNLFMVFLPGFICGICALFIVGWIIAGYINMFLHWGR